VITDLGGKGLIWIFSCRTGLCLSCSESDRNISLVDRQHSASFFSYPRANISTAETSK